VALGPETRGGDARKRETWLDAGSSDRPLGGKGLSLTMPSSRRMGKVDESDGVGGLGAQNRNGGLALAISRSPMW